MMIGCNENTITNPIFYTVKVLIINLMENTSLVVNNLYPRVRDTDSKIYQRKRVGTIKLYLQVTLDLSKFKGPLKNFERSRGSRDRRKKYIVQSFIQLDPRGQSLYR